MLPRHTKSTETGLGEVESAILKLGRRAFRRLCDDVVVL
jgi:hypothetical protein